MGIGTASPMHFCFASYTYVLIKVAWHSAIVCICVCVALVTLLSDGH